MASPTFYEVNGTLYSVAPAAPSQAVIGGQIVTLADLPAIGSYEPSDTNTGVPAGVTLSPYAGPRDPNGNILLNQPGMVLDSVLIDARVIVSAADCQILRSEASPKAIAPSDGGIIDARPAGCKNLLVEDSTLHLSHYDWHLDGIIGHDYTARRVRAYDVIDAFGAYNTYAKNVPLNVNIEGCYADRLIYGAVPTSEVYDGRTHNDDLQIQGSGGVRVIGSRFDGTVSAFSPIACPYGAVTTGSNVAITPNVSPIAYPIEIALNYLRGAARSIGVVKNTYGAKPDLISVHNNLFYLGTSHSGHAIVAEPTVPLVNVPLQPVTGPDVNGNLWDDGTPVNYLRATP